MPDTESMHDLGAEYRAAREGAALFDRSALGKVSVTGRDRLAFLQGMLTNDVKGLQPGQGAPAAFLDAHGKVMVLLVVYATRGPAAARAARGPHREDARRPSTSYLISEKASFEAADDAFAILSVQGPAARGLLEGVAGAALELAPYAHAEVTIGGAPVRVINRSESPGPGFHCWVPAEHAAAVRSALESAGAVPAGDETLAVLRIEAGQPWYRPPTSTTP